MSIPFCKDCRYFRIAESFVRPTCGRRPLKTSHDMVTGEAKRTTARECSDEREKGFFQCGPKGKYFEATDDPERSTLTPSQAEVDTAQYWINAEFGVKRRSLAHNLAKFAKLKNIMLVAEVEQMKSRKS